MKRAAILALILLSGCSTAPLADLLDHFKPSRPGPVTLPGALIGPPPEQPAPTPPPTEAFPPTPVWNPLPSR